MLLEGLGERAPLKPGPRVWNEMLDGLRWYSGYRLGGALLPVNCAGPQYQKIDTDFIHRGKDCSELWVLGSIPASSDTVDSEGRQMKPVLYNVHKKIKKIPLLSFYYTNFSSILLSGHRSIVQYRCPTAQSRIRIKVGQKSGSIRTSKVGVLQCNWPYTIQFVHVRQCK